ncbi:MAG: GIY-YIG nuclease family protein [Hyphomicrobiales bacterium]
MPVSAETLRLLMEAGMTGDELLAVVESIEEDQSTRANATAAPQSSKGYVYLIQGGDDAQCKVGYSKNPWSRANDLSTGRADKLKVIATVRGDRSDERAVHSALESHKIRGEWFCLTDAVIEVFKSVATVDELLSQLPLDNVAGEQKGLSPQTPLSKNSLPPVSPKGKTYPQAEFDEFWAAYPHKTAKPAAVKAFPKALKRAGFPEIMAGLRRYVGKTDDAAWCNPATWLNNDRWDDQPAPPVPRKNTGPPNPANTNVWDDAFEAINSEPAPITIDADPIQ